MKLSMIRHRIPATSKTAAFKKEYMVEKTFRL